MNKKLKILAAADLHGSLDLAKKLSIKATKNKVDLVVLAGDIYGNVEGDGKILEPFSKANQKVLFVPGNWDTKRESSLIANDGKNIHDYYVTYNNIGIAGIGSEDWRLRFDEEELRMIRKNFEKMKPKKRVLVSHLHPARTKAEFSGIPGDEILRRAIEEVKPDILISSHIHEAEGIEDKIGDTKVFQVGRSGKILEI